MRLLASTLTAGALLVSTIVQAQTYRFEATNPTSSAFAFGNGQARHTQRIYRPNNIMDSTLAPVSVRRIYFQNGPNFGSQDSDLDTLRIRMGATSLRNFRNTPSFKNYFVRNDSLQLVYSNPNYIAPAGTDGTWFGIDLTTPYQYDPSKNLILDLQFTGSNSNPSFSLNGKGFFGVGINRMTYAGNLTDTVGSQSSSTIVFFGIDIVTAVAPRKVLTMQTYPNPAQDRVMLGLPNPTEAAVCLIGADGRRVELGTQSGWAAWELPKGLATGLYRVVARQGGLEYGSTLAVQ